MGPGPGETSVRAEKNALRFYGAVAEAVIQHLSSLLGARVTVTLEIEADLPDGAPDNVLRTVTENARTLKFKGFGFEES